MTDINLSLICLLKLQQLPFQRKKNLRPLLNANKITSNITGQFESIDGKDSSYQKFVLTTDLTTVGSTESYYNLYIKFLIWVMTTGIILNNIYLFKYIRITNNITTFYQSKKNTTEQGCIFLFCFLI